MKLEMAILAGDESKKFLVGLTNQLDRLETLVGRLENTKKKANAAEEEDETEEVDADVDADEDDEDEEIVPKKAAKKKKVELEDDEDDEDEEPAEEEDTDEDDDDEDEPAPVAAKKSKKTKAVDAADCSDAAKALLRAMGGQKKHRDAIKKLMKKKFKVESTSELEPEQYAAFVAFMNAETAKVAETGAEEDGDE